MKKKTVEPEDKEKSDKEIAIAKIGYRNSIIVAILGLIGTVLASYLGYLGNRSPQKDDIESTAFVSTLHASATEKANKFPRDTATGYPVIYPSCDCYDDETVLGPFIVRLRWGAKTQELAENGADLVSYSININGKDISDVTQYRKPAIFIQTPTLEGDLPDTWWVYWDIPITDTKESSYLIQVNLITLKDVDNGWNVLPAGKKTRLKTNIKMPEVQLIE